MGNNPQCCAIIAEHSEDNNHDLCMGSESQLAFVCSDFSQVLSQGAPGATARVQSGVSGSYMDAVFKLMAHEKCEIWTSLPHSFTKEGLL